MSQTPDTCGAAIDTKDKRPPLVCVLDADHVTRGELHDDGNGEQWGGFDIAVGPPAATEAPGVA